MNKSKDFELSTSQQKWRRRRRHRVGAMGNLTEQKIRNIAAKAGLTARPGESWAKFAQRVAQYCELNQETEDSCSSLESTRD